ncbi:hypothetical protein HK405_008482 [Cladochytrium tenue]|nr:hypothetical protein HK405_008482 [Cladochytrium tenue]
MEPSEIMVVTISGARQCGGLVAVVVASRGRTASFGGIPAVSPVFATGLLLGVGGAGAFEASPSLGLAQLQFLDGANGNGAFGMQPQQQVPFAGGRATTADEEESGSPECARFHRKLR